MGCQYLTYQNFSWAIFLSEPFLEPQRSSYPFKYPSVREPALQKPDQDVSVVSATYCTFYERGLPRAWLLYNQSTNFGQKKSSYLSLYRNRCCWYSFCFASWPLGDVIAVNCGKAMRKDPEATNYMELHGKAKNQNTLARSRKKI